MPADRRTASKKGTGRTLTPQTLPNGACRIGDRDLCLFNVWGEAQRESALPPPAEDLNALVKGAAKDLADYQRLTAEEKLGEAGQKLEQLKRKLDELNAPK